MPSGEARFSERFEKSMVRIIGAEARRHRASKAIKIATRIAAVLLILLFVSTAVIFSSEALRTKVYNMFANIGEDSVDIGSYEVPPGGIPEGMIMPRYIPEGFNLKEAKKIVDMKFTSNYYDSYGNRISVKQRKAGASIVIDNDGNAYETEISGVKAIAAENDDNIIIAFVYKEYAFVLTGYGEIELSELIRMAESILINC
jgi:hypothetical protein